MKKPVFWSDLEPRALSRLQGVHLVAVGTVLAIAFALIESFSGTMFGLSMVVLGFMTDNGGRA